VEKRPVDKKLTTQVVDVKREKVVEKFGTKHQQLINVPDYRDNEVEIYEETEERRSEEVPKAVFLKETVTTDRLVPIEAVEILSKEVSLYREVPVERLEEVEVPVPVEGSDGEGALALMMGLEARINAQALAQSVSERRFAQEERALQARLDAERSRRKALQEALARREGPASIVREEVKEVEVKREEADIRPAASTSAAEDKAAQAALEAALRQAKDASTKAAAAAAKADEERGAAVAAQLQLKRRLEATLARMQRLDGELRDPAARDRLADFVRVPVVSSESAQGLKLVGFPGESELPRDATARRVDFATAALVAGAGAADGGKPAAPPSSGGGAVTPPPSGGSVASAAPTAPSSSRPPSAPPSNTK
jgi:hypothetical protein